MRRLPIGLILLIGLNGCSWISDAVFGGKDNREPPAPLTEFTPQLEVRTLWTVDAGSGSQEQAIKLRPALYADKVFYADRNGRISAYDTATGALLWENNTKVPISGGIGVGDGLVLVGTMEAEVLALDRESGELVWSQQVSSEVLAAPQAAEGVVVVHSVDGRLTGLNVSDGVERWVYEQNVPVLTLRGVSTPVLSRGLVVVGYANGKLVSLRLQDGNLIWEAPVAISQGRSELERLVDIDGVVEVVDGTVYAASYQGNIAAVSLGSGRPLWQREMSSYAGVGAGFSRVYVTDAQDSIWALDQTNGASLWRQDKLRARRLTAPVFFMDYVVVGDFEGYLHWMAREDGRFVTRVRVDPQGIVAPPIVQGDVLYVGGAGGVLSALTLNPLEPTEP
jgi:outer membrane protein assembly factor BamB